MPGSLESNEKCWYWRIPFTGLKNCSRYSFMDLHCHAGYLTAVLVVEDLLTTSSSWRMLSQSHRLYNFMRIANPPSMRHRACPGICILNAILLWCFVNTRHMKYPMKYWFLFWPQLLSACISFIRKFLTDSCFGSPSERTPNISTFQSVWKYREPISRKWWGINLYSSSYKSLWK